LHARTGHHGRGIARYQSIAYCAVQPGPSHRVRLADGRIRECPMLGHSSIAVTGDIYGHTSDHTARAAVDGWSAVLGL
jgi:hypothetical protein